MEALEDDGDWETLYKRVYPRLFAYALRRLDADAARDAVAETMTRAVASASRYRSTGLGVDAWLFGICRHVVLDAQRAAGRARARAASGYGLPPVSAVDETPSGLDRLLSAEEAAAMRAAFARLSDADRELLELRVVMGLSAEEVASVLGRRPGAVRMAQSRALARLRRYYREYEEGLG